jgi:hypothetical protein
VHRALAIVLPQERNFTRYATAMRGFFAISCEFFYFSRVAGNVLGLRSVLFAPNSASQCHRAEHQVFHWSSCTLSPYGCICDLEVLHVRRRRTLSPAFLDASGGCCWVCLLGAKRFYWIHGCSAPRRRAARQQSGGGEHGTDKSKNGDIPGANAKKQTAH